MTLIQQLEQFALDLAHFYQKSTAIFTSGRKAYVVQVQKKFRKFYELKRQTIPLSGESRDQIFETLDSLGFKSDYYGTNIAESGISTRLVEAPLMEDEEVAEWLSENLSDLLKIPISKKDKLLQHRILKRSDKLLIAVEIVNRRDIENVEKTFAEKNIPLQSMTIGFRDLYLTKDREGEAIRIILVMSQPDYQIVFHQNGSILYYDQLPATLFTGCQEKRDYLDMLSKSQQSKYRQLDFKPAIEHFEVIDTKSSKEQEVCFEAAYALAHKSFKPQQIASEFLTEAFLKKKEENLWKKLLFNVIISGGGFLITLFLLGFILGLIINSRNEVLQSNLDELYPKKVMIERLSDQEQKMQRQLTEALEMKTNRSQMHAFLAELANAIPSGCWLTAVKSDKREDNSYSVVLVGMSRDRNIIHTYLNDLEKSDYIKNLKLEYIQNLASDEMYRTWKVQSGQYSEFRLSFSF